MDLDGTIVILALGSSIVPFMDLMAYLIRLNVYNVSLMQGKPIKLFEDENFLHCTNPDFKLALFYSVRSIEEGYAVDLFKKLVDFNSQYNLKNFEFNLRLSNTGQKRWDSEFIKSKVPIQNIKRVYIGTAEGQEDELKVVTLKCGIPNENIYII